MMRLTKNVVLRRLPIVIVAIGLAGCSMAPKYQVPSTTPVPQFHEMGMWTRGTPEDELPKKSWWTIYGNDVLNSLESKLESANPTLAQALARYTEAASYAAEAESAEFPVLALQTGATRNRQSDNRPLRGANQPDVYDAVSVGSSLGYELDLWGKVRNSVEEGRDLAQAQAAEWGAIRLSLEAQLADDYARLRGFDAQVQLLRDTVDAYERAYNMTVERHNGGIASGLDVDRAETQLEDARAQLASSLAQRALYEHAIGSLVGEPASNFSIAPAIVQLHLPNIPVGVASTLLQRRPDIAAAERSVAAANAAIGVARAAFFPDLTLGAAVGFQDTGQPSLLTAPNLFWSLGPDLALALFDAGAHQAKLDIAKAERSGQVANYRAVVLQAFQDVEDNLVLLNRLAEAADSEQRADKSATATLDLSMSRYRMGAVNYLDVVTAQAAALQAKQKSLSIATERLEASIHLIKALGGGWTSHDLPQAAQARTAGLRDASMGDFADAVHSNLHSNFAAMAQHGESP